MRGYAKWLALTALAFATGCTAESDKTGQIGLAASAAPNKAAGADTAPNSTESDVHLDLDVREIKVRIALQPMTDVGNIPWTLGPPTLPEKVGRPDTTVGAGRSEDADDADDDADDDARYDGASMWITIPSEENMSLVPGANELHFGVTVVPIGTVTQLRIVLNKPPVLWNGDAPIKLPCPSCMTSGLKLQVDRTALIREGKLTIVRVVFDLNLEELLASAEPRLEPIVHVEASVEP